MNQAAIALIAVTIASFFNSLAYIFFKFAHNRIEREGGKGNYILTWQWLTGLFVIIFAGLVNVGKFIFKKHLF